MIIYTNKYLEYLEFKNTYTFDSDSDFVNFEDIDDNYILDKYLEKYYDISSDDYSQKYYDLSYNILRGFPTDVLKNIMELNFETRKVCYKTLLHIEIVKYIYHIWDNKEHELHFIVNKIKNHLIETANMDPVEYYDKNNPKYNRDKHYIYYTWWLYCFYPLLEDGDDLIIKLVNFVYLEDAQDMLMYGIYQMESKKLYNFFKKLLIALHNRTLTDAKGCFDMFESGTGALGQFTMIIDKLNSSDCNILDDEGIQHILKFHFQKRNLSDYKGYLTEKSSFN